MIDQIERDCSLAINRRGSSLASRSSYALISRLFDSPLSISIKILLIIDQ